MRQSGVRVGPTSRDTGPHKRKRSRSQVMLEAETGDTAAARSPQDCRQSPEAWRGRRDPPWGRLDLGLHAARERVSLVLSPQLVAICSGSFQGAGPRLPAGTLGRWVPGSLCHGSSWPSLAKTDPEEVTGRASTRRSQVMRRHGERRSGRQCTQVSGTSGNAYKREALWGHLGDG